MTDACAGQGVPHESNGDLRLWKNLPRDDKLPFIHRFKTAKGKYVYDVNTRRIIRVSPVVWDILEDSGCMADGQLIAKHLSAHGADQVSHALREIAKTREEKGLFLSFRPKQVLPPTREKIQKQLDEQREQLILDVTEDCNFRCSYCVYGGQHPHHRTHSPKAMSWDIARAGIDEFLSHSKLLKDRVVSFYGGEPLLNLPLIRQCVEYIKQEYSGLAIRFSLTTNGSLLRGEAAEFLAKENFLIVVSLDGPPEIHDRNRRSRDGAPSWAKITSNLREFLKTYPAYRTNGALRFNAVANRAMDLEEAQRFWATSELFTDSMGLEINEQALPGGEPSTMLSCDPLAESIKVLYKEFIESLRDGRFGDEYHCRSRWVQAAAFQRPFVLFHKRGYLSPHLPEKMVFLNTCIPGARRTFVRADGTCFACERVLQSREQILGTVKQGLDFSKIEKLLDLWTQSCQEECRYCWCLSHCHMGCLATVEEDGELTEAAKRNACARYRRSMHDLLVEYCRVLEENPKAFEYVADVEIL